MSNQAISNQDTSNQHMLNNIVFVNQAAHSIANAALAESHDLRIRGLRQACGATVIDFGVEVLGGLEAGRRLAEICMGGAAEVTYHSPDRSLGCWPTLAVQTDAPIAACMAAQYAGWPVQLGEFFAMGSGPMRVRRGREALLEKLKLQEPVDLAVGVLECDQLPNEDVALYIAEACAVEPSQLTLCVAPTRSIAGTVQVVARSIETSLHKLFELGFDLHQIVSAMGTAPVPPPAIDFAAGIGRTNDAILYGGQVSLWVDAEDASIIELGPKVPSHSSKDWGRPFAQTFKDYGFDFYRVDPHLFSPAEVCVVNLRSGRSWKFGTLRPDVLQLSFQTQTEVMGE